MHHMFPASVPVKGMRQSSVQQKWPFFLFQPAVAPREKPRTAEPLGYFIKTRVLKRNLRQNGGKKKELREGGSGCRFPWAFRGPGQPVKQRP